MLILFRHFSIEGAEVIPRERRARTRSGVTNVEWNDVISTHSHHWSVCPTRGRDRRLGVSSGSSFDRTVPDLSPITLHWRLQHVSRDNFQANLYVWPTPYEPAAGSRPGGDRPKLLVGPPAVERRGRRGRFVQMSAPILSLPSRHLSATGWAVGRFSCTAPTAFESIE